MNYKLNKEISKKFKAYKSRAFKKNIEFSITIDDFNILITNSCYSCGILFDGKNLLGVDRLNNNEGYTILNSRTCCWDCNRSKSDKSLLEYSKYLGRFNIESEQKINNINNKLKRAKSRNINNFIQAENDETNTSAYMLSTNFVPLLYYITTIETPVGNFYEKGFSIFGNIYKFMDNSEYNLILPKNLNNKLKRDFLLYNSKKLEINVTSEYYFTKTYLNIVSKYRK
jgi:hypothetical protein